MLLHFAISLAPAIRMHEYVHTYLRVGLRVRATLFNDRQADRVSDGGWQVLGDCIIPTYHLFRGCSGPLCCRLNISKPPLEALGSRLGEKGPQKIW